MFFWCISEFLVKSLEAFIGLVFIAFLSAFIRAFSLQSSENALQNAAVVSSPQKLTEQKFVLSQRQLNLIGLKTAERIANTDSLKKPPKSKPAPASEPLVPIHSHMSPLNYTSARPSHIASDQLYSSGGKKVALSPISPSSSPQHVASPATPWSRKSLGSAKGIQSEALLEEYLAQVDEKITESAPLVATPSPPLRGFVISSPSSVATQSTPSGATRSTQLRPVRMSPASHYKYGSPPKKGEGELPPPMSMEQAVEAFQTLGIYPQIELWRNRLRQWFSSMLIIPLIEKLETSHLQVFQLILINSWSINHSSHFYLLHFVDICRLCKRQQVSVTQLQLVRLVVTHQVQ